MHGTHAVRHPVCRDGGRGSGEGSGNPTAGSYKSLSCSAPVPIMSKILGSLVPDENPRALLVTPEC